MDSESNIGAIINVRHIRNPVLLARAVLDTPHVALAGRGAERFAKEKGFKPFYRISKESLRRYNNLKQAIKEGRCDSFWTEYLSDTVGAVALDKKGTFAVATSTGGASPMMVGRVGDTAMVGCGFYCGPHGAVAATGLGEEIIRKMASKFIYDLLAKGEDPETACRKGLALFPASIKTGAIVISKAGYFAMANKGMAAYAIP